MNTSFGKFAELWDSKIGDEGVVSSEKSIDAILSLLGSLKGKSIYEIATGNGFLARKIKRAGAKEVYASDISPELIDLAKKKYPAKGITYLTREATDFTKLPKAHFDAVVIHQGIFYIKDVEKLFKGIGSILKPNGFFIFTILHPLRYLFRQSIGEPRDPLAEAKEYLKGRGKIVKKEWEGEKISYLQYQRPISYYINLCGKQGLLIESFVEPPSQTMVKKKIKKSTIPDSIIIKARKV